MLDFTFQLPTRIIFGRNRLEKIGGEIKKNANRVLLVYGGGSIIRSGLYDRIIEMLKDNGIFFAELSGVQPNPRIDSVRQGVELCRKHDLEMILAVCGGSVIDCGKVIAAAYYYDGDPWDFFTRNTRVTRALPIGAVLTIAATGSEMNGNAVINNDETKEKLGLFHPLLYPRFSLLDPTLTFTVPADQTAAGSADIMSHIFEQYFSPTPGTYVQDRMAEAMLKTCIHYSPIAIEEPDHYEARANLLWTSTLALNGLLSAGKATDWATHMIQHEVSALYDVTHGLGLAILTPHWMQYVLNEDTLPKFVQYARNVWQVTAADDGQAAREGIDKTAQFFVSLGLADRLSEVGVEENQIEEIARKATAYGSLGRMKKLDAGDVANILKAAY